MIKRIAPFVATFLVVSVTLATVRSGDDGAADTGWIAKQAAGFYRLTIGDFKITVLSDGTAPRDLAAIMSKPQQVRDAFNAVHEKLPVEISINCFLIDTGKKKILVDTGAGELFGPPSGKLIENMKAAGYRPEEIDTILLTHIHGDHSGGLSAGGERAFANAEVYVDMRDPAFWLDRAVEANAPAKFKTTFEQSHQSIDPYVDAGKLMMFDGATELLPGIRTIPEYGHTPGLTGYMIESRGERLLVWGDIIHGSEIQFSDPSVTIEYDVDASEAAASRKRILADAAEQGYLVGAAHISFPGLGHVRAEGRGFAWAPMPYSVLPKESP